MSFPIREYPILLSVDSEFTQPPVVVKAGDSYSSALAITLLNNYEAIDLTGLTTKLTVIKPDGTVVYQTPTITDALEGKIYVMLTAQTLAVAGIAQAEVSIYGASGERLTMFEFTFEISANIDPTTAIVSGNDLPAITELINNSHTHINKETLDKVPDNTGVEVDKVLTVGAGGTLTWAYVAGSAGDVTALTNRVTALESGKADTVHYHTDYALVNHNHDGVYSAVGHIHAISDVTGLQTALDSKSSVSHNHDSAYSALGHNHDSAYAGKTATENHITNYANPHEVTKAQVGLGSVDDTSDLDKPISTATQTALNGKADSDHNHAGVYEPVITLKNSGFNLSLGTTAGTVAEGNHTHNGTYEPAFSKNTGFNKNFGTTLGTVSEGNHTHADLHTHTNKSTLDNVTASGDGTQFLANDGTYKTVASQASMEIYDDGVLKGTATKINFATNVEVSVVNGEAIVNATTSGGGGGDMYKTTYDANLNGIADKAESIDDGLGHTASATNIQLAVTNMHTHSNKAILDKVTYTGVGSSIDLKGIEDNAIAIAGKADSGHTHTGVYEPVISPKNSAFNLNLGTTAGTVAEGNHNHDSAYMATGSAYTKTEADAKYLVNTDIVSMPKGVKIGSKRYYNNTGSANTIYVKLGTVTVTGTYNRAFFKTDLHVTGTAGIVCTLDCYIYHSTAYNTINAQTYLTVYNVNGKRPPVTGDVVVVKTDSGSTYTYEFWIKVIGYSTLNTNVYATATEGATLDLLPTTVVTSTTLPVGAVNVDIATIVPSLPKYLTSNFTTAVASTSSFPVGVTYDTTKDSIHVYVSGTKLIKGKHYTATNTTVTLVGFTIGIDEDVLIEVYTNTL